MANIIDYVQWRGDIPTAQVPLAQVDALVLSYLSYMPFDGLVTDDFSQDGMLLSDAAQALLESGLSSACAMDSGKQDCALLTAIRDSERFGAMRVLGYVNRFDRAQEEQFSAVTFVPPQCPAFVSFRGTDSTVVGWKEDFNLSFAGEVPSQRTALAYTAQAAAATGRPLILGGHSKGGNLAVYAGAFSAAGVQEQIRCVYNFDGPGFNEAVIALPEFRQIDMRVHTFVPQSSIIGILLWHAEPFTVVKSDAVGVLQHHPYSWQVMGGRFITLPERTKESRLAEATIKSWLTDMQPQTRRQVIDGIYAVLSVSDGRNVVDLFEAKNVRAILRAVGAMDDETKDAIVEAFRLLGNSLRESLPEWIDSAAQEVRTLLAQRSAEQPEEGGQDGKPPEIRDGNG